MTKQQIEICKKIQKYPRVKDLFSKTGIENYEQLGKKIPTEYLDIKNVEDDERAELFLKDSTIEIMENYDKERKHFIVSVLTAIIAGLGLLSTVTSLILQLTGILK